MIEVIPFQTTNKMKTILKNYKKWAILPFIVLMCCAYHGKAQVTIAGDAAINVNEINEAYVLDRDGKPTSDFSNITWGSRGDLRLESVSADGFTAYYSSVTNNSVNAIGYGLGQVVVSYDDSERPSVCGRPSLGKIISKIFGSQSNVGIVGTSCVNPGDTVTYSIDPLVSVNINERIGIDEYKWIIPNGWPIEFFSGDSSSVTFVVGALSGNDTLRVDIGRANFADNFEYKLPLAQGVAEPVFLQAPPECLPVSETELVVEIDSVSGVSYVWDVPTGWTVTDGNPGALDAFGNVSIPGTSRLVLAINNRGEELILTAFGACDEPLIREYAIERQLDASTSISGFGTAADGCVSRPGVYTFSVNAPIQINWTAPVGWTVDPANSNNATLNITAGPMAQSGYITAQSLECGGLVDSLFMSIAPDTPGVISGPTCLPAASAAQVMYSVAPVENATSYTWQSSNPGWSLVTTTDPSVLVTPNGISGSTISVRANGCASSGLSTVIVSYAPIVPLIGGDICIPEGGGTGSSYQYNVTNPVSGTNYLWRVTGGLTIASGQNSSTINVSATGDVTGDMVEVSAITCDTVTTSRLVTVEGDQGLTFSIANILPGGTSRVYLVSALGFNAEGATFTWRLNGDLLATGPSAAQFVLCSQLDPAPATNTLSVDIEKPSICLVTNVTMEIDPCSSSSRIGDASSNASLAPGTIDLSDVAISPNPAKDQVSVRLPAVKDKAPVQLSLVNGDGKILFKEASHGLETILDVSGYPRGLYYLVIEGRQQPIIRKLLVE